MAKYTVAYSVTSESTVLIDLSGHVVFGSDDKRAVIAEAQRRNGFEPVDGDEDTYGRQLERGRMQNVERATYGQEAISVGTPDYGMNGNDPEGLLADAGDAIANILHYVAQEAPVSGDHSMLLAEQYALRALDKATVHFQAEWRGEDD